MPNSNARFESEKKMKIAVAGTGYVGLSLAVLLSQHNEVHALDIVPEKVEKINSYQSPIQDDEIERFLAEAKAGERGLDLHATVDVAEAYKGADYAVIATPTNYDSDRNFFDTSSVEAAIAAVRSVNPDAWIVIKSTIPVGYTAGLRERLGDSRIFFSPEFLRESRALYDNLHPSRIVVGAPRDDPEAVAAAERFAGLLAQGADPAELERVNADGTIGIPELVLGTTEAEAVKLFANTYLALRVAYFNELDSYAEKNDASLDDYPDALVQLYARNPDARDFVRDYPKKKDLTPTIDLSGLAGSETVPLLLQWDERWGYREYNESIIGLAGCGPTCLSMVTIYLTGDTTKDPLWMCQFAEAHQFNVPGSGSKWALISEGGRMLGLDVTQIPLDKDRIYRNLDVGNPIIVVVGPGDFTTDGHFLVLTGRDGDKITLNDPNSPTNSQKSWDYDTLAGQIQSLWVLRRAG